MTLPSIRARLLIYRNTSENQPWQTEAVELPVVPRVGEYVALVTGNQWYEVHLVVHSPATAQYPVELYVTLADGRAVTKAFKDRHGSQTPPSAARASDLG